MYLTQNLLKDVNNLEKPRILHILSSSLYTDVERSIIHQSRLLNDVCETAITSLDGQITKAMRKNEINFFPLTSFTYKSIENVINTFNPNIIHAHGLDACFIANKFSKNIKIIASIHEKNESLSKFSINSIKFKNASANFEKIVWPSQEVMYEYKNIKQIEEKSLILSKSIDCEQTIIKSTFKKENNSLSFDIIIFFENNSKEDFSRFLNILGILKGRCFTFKCGIISDYLNSTEYMPYIKELRS